VSIPVVASQVSHALTDAERHGLVRCVGTAHGEPQKTLPYNAIRRRVVLSSRRCA
jgi:hypothetical protein